LFADVLKATITMCHEDHMITFEKNETVICRMTIELEARRHIGYIMTIELEARRH